MSDSGDEYTTNPNKTVITAVGTSNSAKASENRDACLVVIYGEDLGRRVPIDEGEISIGRSSKCEVQLDQESVSRVHCVIAKSKERSSVKDNGSTNGTYVNDELVTEIDLRDGDQIKVGRTILKFIVGGNIESQYHEEIYRLMTVDGLTQVNNKRFFDEALEREVSRALRYGRTFSLIMFDIDHFKQTNDSLGHLAGDAVLRKLGTLVTAHVRRDDILCRVGGEEFGIILPEIEGPGAVGLAKKLNRLVDDTMFEFEGNAIDVTISLGVAQWEPPCANADDLVRLADEKLYQAKRTGRNKVCH